MTIKECNVTESNRCNPYCLSVDRKWWYYIATSIVLWLGGVVVILATRIIHKVFGSKQRKLNPGGKDGKREKQGRLDPSEEQGSGFYVRLKEQAGTLITAQTFKGRCLVS